MDSLDFVLSSFLLFRLILVLSGIIIARRLPLTIVRTNANIFAGIFSFLLIVRVLIFRMRVYASALAIVFYTVC